MKLLHEIDDGFQVNLSSEISSINFMVPITINLPDLMLGANFFLTTER